MERNFNSRFTKLLLTCVILLDYMGLAMVVVLFPHLFLNTDSGMFAAHWSNSQRLVMLGLCLAIYPLGQFFGASILGKLSDTYGRKRMLEWTVFGTLASFILSGVAINFGLFYILFISRLIAGLCAGNVAIAQASLIDISTEETKAKNLTLAQMAMGSAYVVGPVLGAVLSNPSIVSWFNPSVPFWFFAVALFIELALVLFLYKDTLAEQVRVKINVLEGLQQIYKALSNKRLGMGFLVWLIFISGWWLFESFMPTFLYQHFRFDTTHIGYLLGFNGALYAAFQYLVVQRVATRVKPSSMVIYSTAFAGLAIISMAFAGNTFQLYAAMVVFVLAMGFCIPGLITSISNLAEKSEQGQVMGMIGSVQALATVAVMIAGGFLNGISNDTTVIGGGVLIMVSWLLFIKYLGGRNVKLQAAEVESV